MRGWVSNPSIYYLWAGASGPIYEKWGGGGGGGGRALQVRYTKSGGGGGGGGGRFRSDIRKYLHVPTLGRYM